MALLLQPDGLWLGGMSVAVGELGHREGELAIAVGAEGERFLSDRINVLS